MVLAPGADALTLGPFGAYLNVTVGTAWAALAVCACAVDGVVISGGVGGDNTARAVGRVFDLKVNRE